ncbi:bifunctional diguanylate cyclase/phosphodiesterase [Pseudorhodoferax sp. Leaf274]|uniref:putative bifunctional diguanylate cyclase/phosphodiesterase n=1 Tax=Pseudorhodoferax sp. Leaf274 TaxID=1736318 RepID=UPI0007031E1B|nr:EAL domain-containing protein [Pseudorhodoferax sp. Leaf274]KQP38945.1 diguanylate phosphodiesterase [Pseudorhodoferax sp. Leaf274]
MPRPAPAPAWPGAILAAMPTRDWRVLVVDSDEDVHAAAQAGLQGLVLFGRPVALLQARTEAEARAVLRHERDLAVALLAVAAPPDTDFGLVEFLRDGLGLHHTRIVLRTELQGPALQTLLRYDIGDCRSKAELAPARLQATVAAALRAYEQLCNTEASRRSLERIVQSGAALLEQTNLHAFAGAVIAQLAAVLDVPGEGLVALREAGAGAAGTGQVLAAAGRFAGLQGQPLQALPASRAAQLLRRALVQGGNVYGEQGGVALYMGRRDGQDMAVYVQAPRLRSTADRQLLDVFCTNLRTLRHNRGLLERLHQSAYFDTLVGLPNRAHFIEKVDACARLGARHHILALLDIDDFSAANDVMGHRFGDRLLAAVARRLAEALAPGVLLARVGPDTFGVLGSTEQVMPQRLLECVREPLLVDGVPHKVTLTCGHVLLPHAAQAGADLVKDATIALKRAKRDHRGQDLRYAEQMGAEARDRALLLSELRTAIDHARLYLVYQPQRDLRTGALVGLEALLRWRTEDGRIVPPDRFIPVAEHSGLIVPLGQWVLATACATMRQMLDAGYAPGRMAVNVSVAQLRDPGFFDTVQAALASHGLQGRHLELEITESVAVLPTQLLESTLSALRAEGITIAIDDFGTGYSSLSYLERLPLDRIKIDRGFVRQIREAQGARIAETVTQLGRKLGLQVLAEGIEDAATWQALAEMGCHEGQGYHIAWPMERDVLQEWLQREAAAEPAVA